jgi:hypothetical protein
MTMPATPSNLISLLRLLDNDLTANVAARLRKRLAEDHQLAEQYGVLQDVMRQEATAETLLEDLGDVDPLDVAEFVEGEMPAERRDDFERKCRSSPSLLREVVAAWNAAREFASQHDEMNTVDRACLIVSNLLTTSAPSPDSQSARCISTPVVHQSDASRAKGPMGANGAMRAAGSNESVPIVRVVPSAITSAPGVARNGVSVHPVSRRRSVRGRSLPGAEFWIVVAGVLIAALALTIQILSQSGTDRTAHPERQGSPRKSPREQKPRMARDDSLPPGPDKMPIPSRDGMPESDVDHDALVRDSGSPDGDRPREQSGDRQRSRGDRVARDDTPKGRPPLPPGPRNPNAPAPDEPRTSAPNNRRATLVAWTDVDGIAGDKAADETAWAGIHSRSAAELWHSDVRSQLVTLPHSRVSGVLAGGPRIIADADSLIEVAAASPASEGTDGATSPIVTPLIAVQRGRLAIDGLRSGQRIRVQVDARQFDIEAAANDTTLAVERVSGETIVAAYHGKLRSSDQELTRRSWGRFDSAGTMTIFQPSRPTDWYDAPAAAPGLPQDLCVAFNAAPNLVQLAAQLESSPDPMKGDLAAQVGLRCLVGQGQPILIPLARRLANSNQSAHRLALVDWLITRYRDDRATGEADLRIICRLLQTAPQTTAAMSGWFQSAVTGQAPTNAQLTELVTNLRDTSPVFVRQSAKYFLQHILNDPLAEYDPDAAANRTAVSSVTRKVRAWQLANQ